MYTPDDTTHNPNWEPVIMEAPSAVSRGGSYTITGIRFNGMSQACMYGDEGQNATNYPLVRITNLTTNHVFYSRTDDHSSMAVESDQVVSTHFDVPKPRKQALVSSKWLRTELPRHQCQSLSWTITNSSFTETYRDLSSSSD